MPQPASTSRFIKVACTTSAGLFVLCVLLAITPIQDIYATDRVILLLLSMPLFLLTFNLLSMYERHSHESLPSGDLDHLLETKDERQRQPSPRLRKQSYLRAGHSHSKAHPTNSLEHLVQLKHLWLPESNADKQNDITPQ